MTQLSSINPLSCFLNRQIDDRIDYCKRLVDSRLQTSENLFRKDLLAHYGCVNAIEFFKDGDMIVSGGDDRRVLVWKLQQALQGLGLPIAMRAQHGSNIFCLGQDSTNTKIFSGGNDDQVIIHDVTTGDPLNYFLHEKPVYGLSVHPENDNLFSSAGDDGRVLIFDIREPSTNEPFCLAQYETPFHSAMFNPVEPRTIATANAEEGVSMWDVRKPMEPILHYGSDGPTQSCMNVRFNSAGTRLLALKRRLPPVLYAVDSPKLLCQFDQRGYYNSCTMKSCCFAGRDESYVLSGSDDFNLYVWKIPDESVSWVESAHMILRGHRSIVNHVRYNPRHSILASSGVEKIIKVWSPLSLDNNCLGGLGLLEGKMEEQRKVYTHQEYLRLVLRSGQIMTHDYSHQSTKEDPRMMAFFDSLVQREIEGWSSEDRIGDQRSPSDPENTQSTDHNHNGTDSDDSTASDTQLMRSVLGTKTCSQDNSSGGVAPELPYGSPNRITRLILSCRDKLLRLAALENETIASQSHKPTLHKQISTTTSSTTSSNSDEDEIGSHFVNSKTLKRKRIQKIRRMNNIRSKYTLIGDIVDDNSSDTESDDILPTKIKKSIIHDTTQPSTSNGLGCNRKPLTYLKFITDEDSQSTDEKNNYDDSCTDEQCEFEETTTTNVHVNGDATPLTKIRKISVTPDSGINSGFSEEKDMRKINGNMSDNERCAKAIESFRKKVDSARRGYRKRSGQHLESESDSSD